MKIILTYGTFDLFHYGHLNLLKRASKLGEYLIVGVSTDEFNLIKNKKCYQRYEERVENLKTLSIINEIIPEESWEQKTRDIDYYGVNTLVMGDDWEGQFDCLKKYCNVIYLSRTPIISSSEIKQILKKNENFR
jgi:glycerol-3-phosphate cytidylyltransferase